MRSSGCWKSSLCGSPTLKQPLRRLRSAARMPFPAHYRETAGEVGMVTKRLRVLPVGERVLEEQLALHGLRDYEREYRFHPTRKWRFDFAFVKEKLAVEVEGGIWVQGAHTRGLHFESDAEKYNEALILGWRVLRVSTAMAMDGRAVEWVRGAMKAGGGK